MEFFGVASVVHPKGDEKVLSTTVVRGSEKDKIKIESSERVSIDEGSVLDLREKFGKLVRTIQETIARQKAEFPCATPVIFAIPDSYSPLALEGTFYKAFAKQAPSREVLRKEARKREALRNSEPLLRTPGYTIDPELFALIKQVGLRMADMLEASVLTDKSIKPEDLEMDARGFSDQSQNLRMTEADLKEYRRRMIIPGWDEEFSRRHKGASNSLQDRAILQHMVRERAEHFAKSLQMTRGGFKGARFMMIGPAALKGDPFFNFIKDDMQVRKCFAEEVMRTFNVTHNICVKCPDDPSSPPFSDVVATMIADNIDRYSGTPSRPTAVMIDHSAQ